MALKSLFWLTTGGIGPKRLCVLIFHRVLSKPDGLFPSEIDASLFDEVCGWLKTWFNVLSLQDALRAMYSNELPPRSLAITFDDGYADNAEVAVPILRRHGLHATFFIATGYLDGGCMWNDCLIEAVRKCARETLTVDGPLVPGRAALTVRLRNLAERRLAVDRLIRAAKYLPDEQRRAYADEALRRAEVTAPRHLMMTSQQVIALTKAGMDLGGHTVNHPILKDLPPAQAREEIEAGRTALERLSERRVSVFAYPNGKPGVDYDDRTTKLVREAGFDAAVATGWGTATFNTDRYQLPRFTPWDRTRRAFGWRLLANVLRGTYG